MRSFAIAVIFGAALLVGCSHVTPGNYQKIKSGMTRDQVYAILGKPDDVNGGGIGSLTVSKEIWNGHDYTVIITFAGDEVSFKSINRREDH